jgi:hypothetical protein
MSKVKNAFDILHQIVSPAYRQLKKENEYLSQLYNATNATNLQLSTWYRLLNQAGRTSGWSFCCRCPGREYRFFDLSEVLQDYTCEFCKTKLDLLGAVGITRETPWHEWMAKLAVLQPRYVTPPPAPAERVMDTWDVKKGASSGEYVYDGDNPGTKEKDPWTPDAAFGDPFSVKRRK